MLVEVITMLTCSNTNFFFISTLYISYFPDKQCFFRSSINRLEDKLEFVTTFSDSIKILMSIFLIITNNLSALILYDAIMQIWDAGPSILNEVSEVFFYPPI